MSIVNLLAASGTIYNIPIVNTGFVDIVPYIKWPEGENMALIIKSRSQKNYQRSHSNGATYITEASVVYYPQVANAGRGIWIKADSTQPNDIVEVELLNVLTTEKGA